MVERQSCQWEGKSSPADKSQHSTSGKYRHRPQAWPEASIREVWKKVKYLLKYSPGNMAASRLSSIQNRDNFLAWKFDLHQMSWSRCGRDSGNSYTEDSGGVTRGEV